MCENGMHLHGFTVALGLGGTLFNDHLRDRLLQRLPQASAFLLARRNNGGVWGLVGWWNPAPEKKWSKLESWRNITHNYETNKL